MKLTLLLKLVFLVIGIALEMLGYLNQNLSLFVFGLCFLSISLGMLIEHLIVNFKFGSKSKK